MRPIARINARNALRAAVATIFGFSLLAATAITVRAADSHWVIIASEGQVQIEAPGGMWTPVSVSNVVQPGSLLRTGTSGRVTVEHNGDHFVIAPDSQVELPKPVEVGLPEARQTFGTVLYNMVPRSVPRFEVKTPYLAAVIKGTVFTVTVGREGAAVQVTRGVVQVHSAIGRSVTLVYPGQTALVSATAKSQVHLIGPNVSPGNGEKSTTHPENAGDGLKSVQADGNDAKIVHAIRPHAESIATLTQGLISNSGQPDATPAANIHSKSNGDGHGHGNGGLPANAVTGGGYGGAGNGLPANTVTGISASAGVGIGNGNSNGNGNGNGAGNANGNGLGAGANGVDNAVGQTANALAGNGGGGNGNGKGNAKH